MTAENEFMCKCEANDNQPWRKDREWIVTAIAEKMSLKIFGLLMVLFIGLSFGAFGFSWATYARVSSLENTMVRTISDVTAQMNDKISKNQVQIGINKDRLERK